MLRKKARSAVFWSGADLFLSQGIRFVISVVLARILLPEDFGTIALLALFLSIATMFVNAGFTTALIQKNDISHVDESTVFWFNIFAGLIITTVLIGIAPTLADFFKVPVLSALTILMAGNVLIGAFGSVHRTLLNKQLDFKVLMKIGIISTIISGAFAVFLALRGYGVWALAWQAVASTLVGTLLIWYYSPWRPLFRFSRNSFRRLTGYSGYIFAADLIHALYQQGYTLLIGKFFGVRELGFYNRANSTQQLIIDLPTGIVSRVTFPLYSSLKNDKERLRRAVRLSIRSVTLITSPMMLGLAILSEQFILTVFGFKWLASAPILQVLCIVGILMPIHLINVSVLMAQGHARLNFRTNNIKKITGVIILVISSFYGVMGVAWGCVIQSIIALIINGHYTDKFLNYGTLEQIKDCTPSIFMSMLMAVSVGLADYWITLGGPFELLILVFIGAAFYFLSNWILGIKAYRETIEMIWSRDESTKYIQ